MRLWGVGLDGAGEAQPSVTAAAVSAIRLFAVLIDIMCPFC
ncbi:MAG: hypothetical protein QOI83_3339, partial [Streptomycetaceae bacterium]|nr:hypothetical protein [Streptomycetaceae bacterium]